MKIFFIICFVCLVQLNLSAQTVVVDSSFAKSYLKAESPTQKLEPAEENTNSITDLAAQIGLGLWERLKYRLNIEGVKESIEAKKDRYIKSPEDKKAVSGV